ncbi:hypothetical protein NRL37_08870 [Metapseudomonas otitidis]|uniref:hypothetical protein n=1 Tax=Metapseudomonas otitidis TaxID=319939 RepID=UPI00227D4C1B|nr:hypothetical protein [Pseudomonas otitidis]WAF87552.1 hypothetical protein NRL37_08870 [Pseudomonas otitidis]
MNQDPRREDELERQLLAHFRAHGEGEPSAELDARILAAAREAVRPPAPSLGQRLHAWLFGPGGRQRWSVAFAGLACLGVGVSLTFQNLDRQPPEYAVAPAPAMAPAAPAPLARSAPAPDAGYNAEPAAPPMQAFSAPAPAAEMKKAAPQFESAPVAALADSATADARIAEQARLAADEAFPPAAKLAKPVAAPLEPALQQGLREVLELRRQGQVKAADERLEALRKAYPRQDLDALLKALEPSPAP